MTISPSAGRHRRLIRARDLAQFRRALVQLAVAGEPFAATGRVLILPTRAAIALFRQTLETLVRTSGGSAFVLPELLTRDEWLIRAHQSLAGAPPLLTAFDREFLMARAARAAAARAHMPRAPFEIRPGLVSEMLTLYDELRRRQRTVRRFARVLFSELGVERGTDRGSESLIHQTCFLAFAFLGYQRAVAASGRLDEHGLRQLILDRPTGFPFSHVVVAVGDHPSDPRGLWPADFDLLGRMADHLDLDVVVTDQMHDAGFRQRMEEELPGIEDTRLDGMAGTPDEESSGPVLIRPGAGGQVDERASGHAYEPANGEEALCFVHHDRDEELRDVARSIRARAALTDCELREPTAIVFQRPLPYLYLARQVLGDARVPFRTFDALPLAGEPYAALLDIVLDVARTGGTRESIAALLRSGLLSFKVARTPVSTDDAAALSNVLSERRASAEAGSYPHEVDEYFGGRSSRNGVDAGRASRAARAAAAVGRALRPFRSAATASEQIRTISMFLERQQRPFPSPDESGARYPRGRAAVLGILEGLADACRRHDDGARQPDTLAAEIRHWVERHTFAPERRPGGVCLVDGVAARFGQFDHVHLVGLVETEWPQRSRRNIFYTTGLLKSLGWPQENDSSRAQQAAFRDLLRLPARTLQLHAFRQEDDAAVGVSPVVELARGVRSTAAEPAARRAVFSDELLTVTPPVLIGLDEPQLAWLRLRAGRPPLNDRRYGGFVGPRAPRTYRVSRVDRYVECPFKYFAGDILGLPEEREEWSGLSPLERGTLVHALFEEFYRRWQQDGRGAVTAVTLQEALELFRQITFEALSRLPEADRALEEARLLGSIVARGLAERVFELEIAQGGEIVDRLVEFGLEGQFTFPKTNGLDQRTVEIRGKADRIDVFASGELRVVDYKLSRLPDLDSSVQVAVYAHAVQQALESRDGRSHPVTQAMYLAFGDERRTDGSLADPGMATLAAITARASDFAAAIEAIESGRFPPKPRQPGDCQWCPYAGVCRKEYATESA